MYLNARGRPGLPLVGVNLKIRLGAPVGRGRGEHISARAL